MTAPGGAGEPAPPSAEEDQRIRTRIRPRPRRGLVLAVGSAVVVLDQLTKAWAVSVLEDGPIALPAGARLSLVHNRGAAFGLGGELVPVLALVALLVVGVLAFRGEHSSEVHMAAAMGGVLGGAVGNLADRLTRGPGLLSGAVVDFVDLGWWPVFNLADVAITLGAATMVLAAMRDSRRSPVGS